MIVFESKDYRIEEYLGLPKRFAVDYKERSNSRVCLVNIGWCDWYHQAVRLMNQHFEARLTLVPILSQKIAE